MWSFIRLILNFNEVALSGLMRVGFVDFGVEVSENARKLVIKLFKDKLCQAEFVGISYHKDL